jgi:hypothetical protein
LPEFIWNKPVLSIYRENNEQPETEPFAVIKAKKLVVSESENQEFNGKLEGFFCLMGNVHAIQSANSYVLCWFDDSIEDFTDAFRRLSGVTFPRGVSYTMDKRNKRTYNTFCHALHAKLR